MSARFNFILFFKVDGDVYGFGSNLSGQLGLGREVLSFSVPECVETLLGKHICAAACGEIHTAFLTGKKLKIYPISLKDICISVHNMIHLFFFLFQLKAICMPVEMVDMENSALK